jgi:hypothetical protein
VTEIPKKRGLDGVEVGDVSELLESHDEEFPAKD